MRLTLNPTDADTNHALGNLLPEAQFSLDQTSHAPAVSRQWMSAVVAYRITAPRWSISVHPTLVPVRPSVECDDQDPAAANRLATVSQLTTFHQAVR